MALSLDAPDAERHDAFRGVRGTFNRTIEAIETAKSIGMGFQIHSTVCQETAAWFDEMASYVRRLEPLLWSVFFLVPVGRGIRLNPLDSLCTESVLSRLHGFSRTMSFDVKTTEAPQYRRIALQHGSDAVFARRGFSKRGIPPGINDGKGFVFISHMGGIYPSGFLNVCCGNTRTSTLKAVYQFNPLMRMLRDPNVLRGKCGFCEFRTICGGSRARAWAATGDPLAEDPACPYKPQETRT
jgi:radical SAM protein with 4Fe4S-binding SPASM domain